MSHIAQKQDMSATPMSSTQLCQAAWATPHHLTGACTFAHRGRHPRHQPQGVERLERQAAGRPVPLPRLHTLGGARTRPWTPWSQTRKQRSAAEPDGPAQRATRLKRKSRLWDTLDVSYFMRHDAATTSIGTHANLSRLLSLAKQDSKPLGVTVRCAHLSSAGRRACRCMVYAPDQARFVRAHLRLFRQRRLQHSRRQGAHHTHGLCARHLPGRGRPDLDRCRHRQGPEVPRPDLAGGNPDGPGAGQRRPRCPSRAAGGFRAVCAASR